MSSKKFFKLAIEEANKGIAAKEGAPFGACIVKDGKIIASAHDTVLKNLDPTCHAEINAIRLATKVIEHYSLKSCEIYCTSEPCPMCLAAIHWAGIKRCFFIADKTLASQYGFDDQLLYEELSKPFPARKIPMIQDLSFNNQAEKLFLKWQEADLPIC